MARRFKPEKISLFGSYACGIPTLDSDVDLLVIMPQRRRRGRMSIQMRGTVPRVFPLNLRFRSGSEVDRRLQWGDCFLQGILAKGSVLYEAAHA